MSWQVPVCSHGELGVERTPAPGHPCSWETHRGKCKSESTEIDSGFQFFFPTISVWQGREGEFWECVLLPDRWSDQGAWPTLLLLLCPRRRQLGSPQPLLLELFHVE